MKQICKVDNDETVKMVYILSEQLTKRHNVQTYTHLFDTVMFR